MKTKSILFTLFIFFCFLSIANAILIDFRTTDFSTADYSTSFYYAPEGLTLTPEPFGALLYQDSIDGIGVRYDYEADEIEGTEFLHIRFDIPKYLHKIMITDLFNEPSNNGEYNFLEKGYYSFDKTSWNLFYAGSDRYPSPITNGELTILFGSPTIMTDIWFKSPGWKALNLEDHEFSVAAMEVTAVPEPSTFVLLGSGLMWFIRKRIRK